MSVQNRDFSQVSGKLRVYLYSTAILAMMSAILRTASYFLSFDEGIGYFSDSVLLSVTNSLTVAALLWCVSGFILIPGKAFGNFAPDFSGNSVFLTSLVAGFVMTADFVYKIYTYNKDGVFKNIERIFSDRYAANDGGFEKIVAVLTIVGLAASLLSAVCFFVRSSTKLKAKLAAALGLFPLLRLLSGVGLIYFDMKIQMNSPSKLILEFAIIALMLYFVYEERLYLAGPYAKPKPFFVFGLIALVLSLTAGISELAAYYSGFVTRGDFCIESFICLVLSLYVLARLSAFAHTKTKPVVAPETSAPTKEAPEAEEARTDTDSTPNTTPTEEQIPVNAEGESTDAPALADESADGAEN